MHRPVSWQRQRFAVAAPIVIELKPKSERSDSTGTPQAKHSHSAAQTRLSHAPSGSQEANRERGESPFPRDAILSARGRWSAV